MLILGRKPRFGKGTAHDTRNAGRLRAAFRLPRQACTIFQNQPPRQTKATALSRRSQDASRYADAEYSKNKIAIYVHIRKQNRKLRSQKRSYVNDVCDSVFEMQKARSRARGTNFRSMFLLHRIYRSACKNCCNSHKTGAAMPTNRNDRIASLFRAAERKGEYLVACEEPIRQCLARRVNRGSVVRVRQGMYVRAEYLRGLTRAEGFPPHQNLSEHASRLGLLPCFCRTGIRNARRVR